MKYNILNQAIPQNSRRELNDKILYLIDNDLAESSGITKEDIYNAYTGDGGLHGLNILTLIAIMSIPMPRKR